MVTNRLPDLLVVSYAMSVTATSMVRLDRVCLINETVDCVEKISFVGKISTDRHQLTPHIMLMKISTDRSLIYNL